jgi:thymidylate kinase
MKNIMISGPDGTGKSTIVEATKQRLVDDKMDIETVWLRFHHYFAKVVNMFGRITGKSYREHHDWGEVGYHNYEGFFGIVYIVAVYLDHHIFLYFLKNIKLRKDKNYIVDRYILDVVADLIVDTKNDKFVFLLFDKFVKEELLNFDVFILECDENIVTARRKDIKDDKNYVDKINAYRLISSKYNLTILNTGERSVDEIVQKIIK